MQIKILGPGCKNCEALAARTHEALTVLGKEADIVKVTAYPDIAAYGIMSTPGLVVDEEVLVHGRVPSTEEIRALLAHR